MKLILILDLPSLDRKNRLTVAQSFVDALVASPVNDDAIIHTVTSLIPTEETSDGPHESLSERG